MKFSKILLTTGLSFAFLLACNMPSLAQISNVQASGGTSTDQGANWGQVNSPGQDASVSMDIELNYEIEGLMAMVIFDHGTTTPVYPGAGVFAAAPSQFLLPSDFTFDDPSEVMADLLATTDNVQTGTQADFAINGVIFTYPRGEVIVKAEGNNAPASATNGVIALYNNGIVGDGEISVKLRGWIGNNISDIDTEGRSFSVLGPKSVATPTLVATDVTTAGYGLLRIFGDVDESTVEVANDKPGTYTGTVTVSLIKQ